MNDDLQPIIVGVAQHTWRDVDAQRTPLDALQAVATAAMSDTHSEKILPAIDAWVHIPFIMNQVPDLVAAMPVNPGAAVAARLGMSLKHYTADVGGNLPQELLGLFARRLARGEHQAVLIGGAELLASFLGTLRGGGGFPEWGSGRSDEAECLTQTPTMSAATELAHGLFEPVNAYPLFESALRHAKAYSKDQHRAVLGGLISRMSEVAAANPYAWKQTVYTVEQVLDAGAGNRMVSTPYTKLMNAIIAVDQAAAVVLTTVAKARELGIDPARWIYLRGDANAHDAWYLGERESLHASRALQLAAGAALDQSGFSLDEITHFDLYSCFPSAVQVACDALGLAIDDPRGLTVTGGLTLFGGPGNNYSLHAIAAMVDRLRCTSDGAGLISANGGYLTKHAVGVYSKQAPTKVTLLPEANSFQSEVDAHPGPPLTSEGEGDLTLLAHTVRHDRQGPKDAVVLGTLSDGRRCVAVSEHAALLDRLSGDDCVGQTGVVTHKEGLNHFEL